MSFVSVCSAAGSFASSARMISRKAERSVAFFPAGTPPWSGVSQRASGDRPSSRPTAWFPAARCSASTRATAGASGAVEDCTAGAATSLSWRSSCSRRTGSTVPRTCGAVQRLPWRAMDVALELLRDAGAELERAVALAEDPGSADAEVCAAATRAAGLALRGILRDRGINAAAGADAPALEALLQEAALRPPEGVAELVTGSLGRTEAMTAALAAV